MLIIVASIFVSIKKITDACKRNIKETNTTNENKKTNIHKKLFIFLADTIFKDESLPQIMNFSQRENLILVSVNYIKKCYRDKIFGYYRFFKNE